MVETRVAPRFKVAKQAKIDYGGVKTSCVVRDISATGAAVEFSDVIRLPTHFTLIVPEDALRLKCRVVWRRGYRAGITFDL